MNIILIIRERKIKIPHSAEFEVKVLKKKEDYVSLQEALSKSDWSKVKKIKKISPLLWAILSNIHNSLSHTHSHYIYSVINCIICLVLWKFQQEQKRLPDVNNVDDIGKLNSIKNLYLKSLKIETTTTLDELIE